MYLKINGEETRYNVTLNPFTSQHGYRAVRFIGDEVPSTYKGFGYYDDEDKLKVDLSDYKYEYHQNEYTVEEEHEELPSGTSTPQSPSALDRLSARVSQLSSEMPVSVSKTAYIGDESVSFDLPKDGAVSVDTQGVPYFYKKGGNGIHIFFESPIEQVTEVTVTIL